MDRSGIAGCLLVLAVAPANQAWAFDSPGKGQWSSRAAYLWPGLTVFAPYPQEGRTLRVPSPDRKMAIVVRDSNLNLSTNRNNSAASSPEPVESLAEVLWSPDSQALAVTQMAAGSAGGPWKPTG